MPSNHPRLLLHEEGRSVLLTRNYTLDTTVVTMKNNRSSNHNTRYRQIVSLIKEADKAIEE